MFKSIVVALVAWLMFSSGALAATCVTWPYPLMNNTTADASQVMGDFTYLAGCAAPLASPSFTGNVGIGTSSPAANLDIETSTTYSSLQIGATSSPGIKWYSSSGAADQKYWDLFDASTYFAFRAVNDTYSASTQWLQVNRGSGYTIASVNFPSGKVGIGTTSPSYLLHVGSSSASGVVAEFQNSAGNCTITPPTSTWSCTSDERLKKDIADAGEALPELANMRVRDFTLKSTGERRTGVIAQELLPTHPDMVHEGRDGFYTVDAPNPWMLVKAIQELKAENDQLRARLAALEAPHHASLSNEIQGGGGKSRKHGNRLPADVAGATSLAVLMSQH